MDVQHAAVSADPALNPLGRLRSRTLLLLAAAVIGCAVLFAATVGHGYLVSGMLQVPLSEVGSGAHDPKDLPGAMTPTSQVLGWLAIATAPLAGFVGLVVAGVDLLNSVRERRTPRQLVPAATVVVLSAAMLVGCVVLSPLAAWWMD